MIAETERVPIPESLPALRQVVTEGAFAVVGMGQVMLNDQGFRIKFAP